MAIIHNNSLTQGLRGSIDHIMFRQLRGKTIVSKKPSPARKQSESQRENRNKFKMASRWAKCILLNPEKKAYYLRKAKKLKLPNAYTAAVCDYLRKGKIMEVDFKRYQGKAGQPIQVKIDKKDFAAEEVNITLFKNGIPVESGWAKRKDKNKYIYNLQQDHGDKSAVSIQVMLYDHGKTLIQNIVVNATETIWRPYTTTKN